MLPGNQLAMNFFMSLEKRKLFDDEPLFEMMFSLYQLALAQIETGRMIFMVGVGGSKDLHSILDQYMLGNENFGFLEASYFSDRKEFKKSGHFALNKIEIRIQEASNSSPINSDNYKNLIVGETMPLR